MRYDRADLREAVLAALARTDGTWYGRTLQAAPCGCELTEEEQRIVLDGCMQAAAEMAAQLAGSPHADEPLKLAERLHLHVVHTREELREPFLYLGLYEPDTRTITLNDSALTLICALITQHGLEGLTPAADVQRLALYHEIFHALEEQTPGIYTRSRMLERKSFGLFPSWRGLDGASEVGAIHFSKCMAGVSYSPCIYERYLLWALGISSIDF
ncbi:MAG: hypothetical protein RR215_01335 [Ruthenibacterium sp.]